MELFPHQNGYFLARARMHCERNFPEISALCKCQTFEWILSIWWLILQIIGTLLNIAAVFTCNQAISIKCQAGRLLLCLEELPHQQHQPPGGRRWQSSTQSSEEIAVFQPIIWTSHQKEENWSFKNLLEARSPKIVACGCRDQSTTISPTKLTIVKLQAPPSNPYMENQWAKLSASMVDLSRWLFHTPSTSIIIIVTMMSTSIIIIRSRSSLCPPTGETSLSTEAKPEHKGEEDER